MTTTLPVPARSRLYAARTAIEEARATFLREAADTPTGDRLDWLYATAAELRGMAERIGEVLR